MTAVCNYELDKYIEKLNGRVKTKLHIRMVTCYYNNLKKKPNKQKKTRKPNNTQNKTKTANTNQTLYAKKVC